MNYNGLDANFSKALSNDSNRLGEKWANRRELVEVNEILGHVQYENNFEVQGQQTKLVPSLTELREKTGASFPVDPDITAMPIAAWAALFPDEPGYQIKEHYNRTSSPARLYPITRHSTSRP